MRILWSIVGLSLFLGEAAPEAQAGQEAKGKKGPRFSKLDVSTVAAPGCQFIAAGCKSKRVQPAPRATDAEFLRRVYLDIAGRTPFVTEVRDFLDDKQSDKRAQLVLRLLRGPNYVNHFTAVWRSLMIPPSN